MSSAFLRRRGDVQLNVPPDAPAGGDKLDPLNYVAADPNDNSPPSVLEVVDGALVMRTNSALTDNWVELFSLTDDASYGAAHGARLAIDPAHLHGVGVLGDTYVDSTITPRYYRQLHNDPDGSVFGHYYDDRIHHDADQFRAELSLGDSGGSAVSIKYDTVVAVSIGNHADGSRIEGRMSYHADGTCDLRLEQIAAGGGVAELASALGVAVPAAPALLAIRKLGHVVKVESYRYNYTDYGLMSSASVTLSDADEARFREGYLGFAWSIGTGVVDGALPEPPGPPLTIPSGPTRDNFMWFLRLAANEPYLKFNNNTSGQIFTPTLDTPVGPDVALFQKIDLGASLLNPGTLDERDSRDSPFLGGACIKWADHRTGIGVTTLGAPRAFDTLDGTTGVNVVSTAGIPDSGTIIVTAPYPSEREVTLNYTGRTPDSFTGVSVAAAIHSGDLAVPYPADSIVRPRPGNPTRGVFSWWDADGGGIGMYIAYSWNDLMTPDQIFIECGHMKEWSALAADWAFDPSGGSAAPQPNLQLVDASHLPDSSHYPAGGGTFPVMVCVGNPHGVLGTDWHYAWVTWTGKAGNTLTGVTARWPGPPDTGPFTFLAAAAAKLTMGSWNLPLYDGMSISGPEGYGDDSSIYFDGTYPFAGEVIRYGNLNPAAFKANQVMWTCMRAIGNEISFELWEDDPTVPGNTYKVRMRVVLHDSAHIAALGAAVSGGIGPWGWMEPFPTTKILDWWWE